MRQPTVTLIPSGQSESHTFRHTRKQKCGKSKNLDEPLNQLYSILFKLERNVEQSCNSSVTACELRGESSERKHGSHFRLRRITSNPSEERAGHDVMAACGGTGSEFTRLSYYPPLSSPTKGRNSPLHPPPSDFLSSSFPAPHPPTPSFLPSCSCLCSVLGHHMLEDRALLCGNTAGIETSLS